MSDQPTSAASGPPSPQRRRSSFAELFTPRINTTASTSSSPPSTSAPSTAIAAPLRRGASISGLGLSGTSPTQSSPYTAFARQRRASISTSGSGSPEFRNSFGDEPAVIEEDPTNSTSNVPPSPTFARRMSFGAQALRDVKGGGSGGPAVGEGFNWSEALRDKTKRSPSFSSSANPFASRVKAPSAAPVEPPKEMPKPVVTPTKMKKPDHLGERMLRGDFMMD